MFFVLITIFLFCFIPFCFLTKLKVHKIFTPINYSIFLMTLSALPGSILILIYDQVYFNKIVDTSRSENLELYIVLLLSCSLILFYFFSLFENRPLIRHDLNVKMNLIYALVVFFILYFSVSRLNVLMEISSSSATERFLLYRTRVAEIEAGTIYFFKYLLIDCIAWILALALSQKKNLNMKDRLYLFVVGFYFLISFTKSKLLLYVISIWVIRNRMVRLSLWKIFKLGLFVATFLILTWMLLLDFDSLNYLYDPSSQGLVARIFISEISALYTHLYIFDSNTFIGFSSVSNTISEIFGLDHSPRSGEIVMQTMNPGWLERGIKGTFNTHFYGEAFANFGAIGLLVSSFFVPCVLLLYSYAVRFLNQTYRYPVFIFLTFNLSVMSGLNNFLYNPFLMIVIMLFILFGIMRRYVSPTC